jgi:hypothetical protein
MKFHIELHSHGVKRDTLTVGASKAYTSGAWHDGWPWVPRHEHMAKGLPYRYRRAFERAPIWWSRNGDGCDVLRCDLRRWDGAPMGSIFARFDPAALVLPNGEGQ